MEIKLNWESLDSFDICDDVNFWHFLNENVLLYNNVINKDFTLKYNNNLMNKYLIDNKLKDISSSFSFNTSNSHLKNLVEIEVSESLKKELSLSNNLIKNKKLTLKNIESEIEELNSQYERLLNVHKLMEKLERLILEQKKIQNDTYRKIYEKLFELFYLDEKLKDLLILDSKFQKKKINEIMKLYLKMMDLCLEEVYAFFYKFAATSDDHSIWRGAALREGGMYTFCWIYKGIIEKFINSVNDEIKQNLIEKKIYEGQEKIEKYDNVFKNIIPLVTTLKFYQIFFYKANFSIFYSFDKIFCVKVSKCLFLKIRKYIDNLIQIHKISDDLIDISGKDYISDYTLLSFKTALEVYNIFNIKIEDYLLSFSLYN